MYDFVYICVMICDFVYICVMMCDFVYMYDFVYICVMICDFVYMYTNGYVGTKAHTWLSCLVYTYDIVYKLYYL